MPHRDLTIAFDLDASVDADRHADQLRKGFRWLRFEPGLEADYRQVLLKESLKPAILINIAAIFLWACFAIFDIARLDLAGRWPLAPDIWVLLISRWLVMVLLIAYLMTATSSRVPLDWRAFSGYMAVSAGASITAIIYKANGLTSIETMQIVLVMSAFLPISLRFYGALTASLALLSISTIAGLVMLSSDMRQEHAGLLAVMAIAIPIAAVGGYIREHSHRRQFLLSALLNHQAQFDSLTNLANRRLFERHANAAITHAARTGEALTLAVIDIDLFKQFNDRHGHAAGDEALRLVAEIIADTARRPMDMAARLGGEEFALLMFDTDLNEAEPLLEKMRQRIAALELLGQPLTISIGATCAEDEALDVLYRRADTLLYRSKQDGRNRLSVDTPAIQDAR